MLNCIKKGLMKIILKYFLIQFVLLISSNLYAQVGIGTTTPDVSSMLDISSNNKGLLMPRLTTTERDNITLPATGLMIYNTTLSDGQLNIGTSLVPNWIGIKSQEGSVTESDNISTTSTSNLLVSGMTMSPQTGTYLVLFNAQITTPFSSSQSVVDMESLYEDLMAITATSITHPPVFGNGETLGPGVYDVTGVSSITGTLTLDGGGDSNSMFVIRSTGTFSTGVGSTVDLINGANSSNIFWVSEVALSTAANTTMKGALVSSGGAISLGDSTNLEGRMFTKAGGLSIVSGCILTAPSGDSIIDLGVLSSLVMFTSGGAVSDAVTSIITGDVATASGALAIAGTHFGEQYPAGTIGANSVTYTTYSIYQNGVEVVNSRKTINSESSMVSLQAMATNITLGESIEVRWKVNTGETKLDNRTLSLIRSEN